MTSNPWYVTVYVVRVHHGLERCETKIGIDSVTVPKNGAMVVGGGSGLEMWKCLAL